MNTDANGRMTKPEAPQRPSKNEPASLHGLFGWLIGWLLLWSALLGSFALAVLAYKACWWALEL